MVFAIDIRSGWKMGYICRRKRYDSAVREILVRGTNRQVSYCVSVYSVQQN